MDSKESTEQNEAASPPAPEELKPLADDSTLASGSTPDESMALTPEIAKKMRHGAYRPSHKATFVGLIAVVLILAINAGAIFFVLKGKSSGDKTVDKDQVTISQSALDKLGVNRSAIGDAGIELVVNPNSSFKGKVQVGGDVSIAGQLKLNSKFSASDANLTKLDAGDTSLAKLNVNGDGTVSSLNLRKDLVVAGLSRLQGPVTISQLLTVENNVNIAGNLSVGGTLAASGFHASSLISDSTLTIGGHVITRGAAPSVSPGGALGTNGTVSISGNDASGTVAANIGVGAGGGIIANIFFHTAYSNTPHVVVSAVGAGVGSVYVIRNTAGFSIGVNGGLGAGGYAFDYIVQQ